MNVRNILILFVNTVDSNYVMSRLVYVVLTALSFDFSFKRLFYCLKLIAIFTELNFDAFTPRVFFFNSPQNKL